MSDSVWPHWWQPTRLLCPWDSPGKNIGVGCHFLLQHWKFGVLNAGLPGSTPKAEVFKKWPLSPFKKKKNCLHKNWPMRACIYMVPRVLTCTDLYNCHHKENTQEFHHQNTCWPQTVLTLPVFADPTVLPFPECHINGSLQHVAFLNWLFQHRCGCTDGCPFTEGSVPGEGCHSVSSHSPGGRC